MVLNGDQMVIEITEKYSSEPAPPFLKTSIALRDPLTPLQGGYGKYLMPPIIYKSETNTY